MNGQTFVVMPTGGTGGECLNVRKPRTALFSLSSARRVLPHAETRFPRAEDRLRMRRFMCHVRRTVSACGDRCSACGELSLICILYTQKAAL